MLTVLQRVSNASVFVAEQTVAEIHQGLLILCGFEPNDDEQTLTKMLDKVLKYRIFEDEQGKMNLSLQNIKGSLLLVPQFTLMADTSRGLRPSFSKGAPPDQGHTLFEHLKKMALARYNNVCFGQFGADMDVRLCNDGPVTFVMSF